MSCGFEYTIRWPQIAELWDVDRTEAVRLLEEHDRELELWTQTICDCCNPTGGCPTVTDSVSGPIVSETRTLDVSGITDLDDLSVEIVCTSMSGSATDVHVHVELDASVQYDNDVPNGAFDIPLTLAFGSSLVVTFTPVGGDIDDSNLTISATCAPGGGG